MSQLTLSALRSRSTTSINVLRSALRERGFAVLRVDDDDLSMGLKQGLEDAAALEGFRFPPNDQSPTVYTPQRRNAFRALYTISVIVFQALLNELQPPEHIRQALGQGAKAGSRLFGAEGNGHEPFAKDAPFAQSFFNLFNYDSGLLNPHCDRSLLTIVKVAPSSHKDGQSALWVRDRIGHWHNADRETDDHSVIVMIGEDCEALPCIHELGLYGAEHAVRVNPDGEYLAHSHFRPDPETRKMGNRRSAAFILRHDPTQT